MRTMSRQDLWNRLRHAGLVQGDLPASAAAPWYVRVMLGIAGWIGALFFLGFIGAGFAAVLRSSQAAAVAGVACCCGAYAIFTRIPRHVLANQFGLATGIAGQVLFAVAVAQAFNSRDPAAFFLFFLIEAALTALLPNFIHRLVTTVAAVAALSLGLGQAGLHGVAVPVTAAALGYLWRREMRLPGPEDLWQAVGYGLALGLLLAATTTLLHTGVAPLFHGANDNGWLQRHGADVGTLLASAVFLWVAADILRELGIEASSTAGIVTLGCATILLAVSFPAHVLAPPLLLVLLGFAAGNTALLGLGFVATAGFLSHYYYQMHETLLLKALILGETGALLLIARYLLGRLFPVVEDPTDA